MMGDPRKNWVLVRLGDVCEPVTQRGPSAERDAFRYIDLGAIDNKTKRVSAAELVPTSAAPSRAKQNVRAGDIVFSTVRVYLENIAEVPEDLDGEVASTAFCVLRPARGIASRYVYHYVTSRPFVLAVNQLQRGNSPPSVQDGDVRAQPFPVAPQQEQQRIASRIDELFSRIEEGERALERVQKLVERYRQSVLKAAVTGELSRDWREKNKGKLESGEDLLTHILKARREAWEKAELDKMKAKGIEPASDKWKQKYEEPAQPDTRDLATLPAGWIWASMAQLAWASSYGTSEKCGYGAAGPAVLRIPNVRSGRFDFVDMKNATSDLGLQTGDLVSHGDLLVVRTNGSDRIIGVGAVSLANPLVPCYFASYLIRFRLVMASELALWINFCWQSSIVRDFVNEHKATSAGQYNVSQSSLMELCLPIPPLGERDAIVDEVERVMSRSENAAGSVFKQSALALALRQTVLSSAFSGTLTPQDAADESAAVLLKRVSLERAAVPAKTKRGAKTRSKTPL